jgi:hypothetical protein
MPSVRSILGCVASGVMLWGLVGSAHAGMFRGAKSAMVVVAPVGAEGQACGLDDALVMAALSGPLGETKLDTEGAGRDLQIYAQVSTLRVASGDCVSSVSIKVQARSSVDLAFSKIEYTLPVGLFDESAMVGSSRPDHRDAVAAGIDEVIRKFSQAYDLDTRW